jgi:hypothetical protein
MCVGMEGGIKRVSLAAGKGHRLVSYLNGAIKSFENTHYS